MSAEYRYQYIYTVFLMSAEYRYQYIYIYCILNVSRIQISIYVYTVFLMSAEYRYQYICIYCILNISRILYLLIIEFTKLSRTKNYNHSRQQILHCKCREYGIMNPWGQNTVQNTGIITGNKNKYRKEYLKFTL